MKKIFVSSTFRDMQYERDTLHNLVIPTINKIAKQYGEYIDLLDLRWGVNTSNMSEEEACQKVVDSCLFAIDHCRSYMIAILGDRYGWIPDDTQMRQITKNKNWEPIHNSDLSITALEIEYGALRNPSASKDRVLFYRRIIDGELPAEMASFLPENKDKIDRLTDEISKHYQIKEYHVRWDAARETFEGMDSFAKMVEEDLVGMMQKDWESFASKSPFEQEFMRHKNHFLYLAENLAGNSGELDRLLQEVQEKPLLVITGEKGIGKTSLICMVGLMLERYKKVPCFCGLTPNTDSAKSVAEYIIQYISKECGCWEDPTPSDDLRIRMAKAMMHLERFPDRKICFLIDGIDELPKDANLDDLVFVPSYIPQNVRFVLTAEDPALVTREHQTYMVPERSAGFQKTIIRGYLQRKGKELPEEVIQEILAAERSKNSLYIQLLVRRLCMLQGSRLITAKDNDELVALELETIRSSDTTLKGLCKQLLDDAGEHLGCPDIKKMMQYISVSKRGLLFADTAVLLRAFDGVTVDDTDYSNFLNYMGDFICEMDSGRIAFREPLIKEAILDEMEPESIDRMQQNILRLCQMWKDDPDYAQDMFYYGIISGNLSVIADFIADHWEDETLAKAAGRDWIEVLTGCQYETAIKQIDVIYQVFSHPNNKALAQCLASFVHDCIRPVDGKHMSEWICAAFVERNVAFVKALEEHDGIRRELAADIYTDAALFYLRTANLQIEKNPYMKAWELLTAGYGIYKDLNVIQTDLEKQASYYYEMARILSDRHVLSAENFREANRLFVDAASAYEVLLNREPTISLVLSCLSVYQGIRAMCYLSPDPENHKIARRFSNKGQHLLEDFKYLFSEKTEMWDQVYCSALISAGAMEKDPAEAMRLRLDAVEKVSKFMDVNNIEVRSQVASAYANLAASYKDLGDVESLKRAAECYEVALINGIYLSERVDNFNSRVATATRVVNLLETLISLYSKEQADETLSRIRAHLKMALDFCGVVFNSTQSIDDAQRLLTVMLWQLDYGGLSGLERIRKLQTAKTIIEGILMVDKDSKLADKLEKLDADAARTYLQTGIDSEKLETAEYMQNALFCYEEAVNLFGEIAHKEPSVINYMFLTESLYRKARHPDGHLSEIEFRNLKAIVLKMYEVGNRDPFLLEMREYVLNI